MMLVGRIFKEASGWCVEVDAIGAYTCGTSRKDAGEMLVDLIHTMLGRTDLKVTVADYGTGGRILVASEEPATLAALVLRYQRERNGLSLADVAAKLGASSRTTYARYEQGSVVPAIDKYSELLAAVAPDMVLVFAERKPARSRKPAASASSKRKVASSSRKVRG